MDTAAALRRARIRAGLTQHALAARAGTSQATVSAYESGRKRPSIETLDRLLAATGAGLAVVDRGRPRGEPGPEELARADRSLQDVLGLAAALPVRHRPTLEFPRLVPRRQRAR
jgi:transcriptional regulator with XRE-family HTH domain